MLKPLTDHLLVKPLVKEGSKSGLVLPDSEKDRPERGEVIAVGDGRILDNGTRLPMSIKVGDKILFRKYTPDEIKEGAETFLMLSESDVLAIIN